MDISLNEKIVQTLDKQSASFRSWTYPLRQYPGMWVVSSDGDEPGMIEYKNYLIMKIPTSPGRPPKGWRAYYNDMSDYPSFKAPFGVDFHEDDFVEPTLDKVYERLLKIYKKYEPVQSDKDYEDWMSIYRGNKARYDADLHGKTSPDYITRQNRKTLDAFDHKSN